jgi:hypothetical protein
MILALSDELQATLVGLLVLTPFAFVLVVALLRGYDIRVWFRKHRKGDNDDNDVERR